VDYSRPESENQALFYGGFDNRRSPPVSILRTVLTVIPVRVYARRSQVWREKRTLRLIAKTDQKRLTGPPDSHITDINAHQRPSTGPPLCATFPQWSDGRKDGPLCATYPTL